MPCRTYFFNLYERILLQCHNKKFNRNRCGLATKIQFVIQICLRRDQQDGGDILFVPMWDTEQPPTE